MEKNNSIEIRAEDLCRRCERQYTPQFTPFLTPEEQVTVMRVSRSYPEVLTVFLGGISNAERKVAGFFPADYYTVPETEDDFTALAEIAELEYVKIAGSGFVNLGHRDILGSLMSLGIKRETIGDIVISDDNKTAFVVVSPTVAGYICESLERVARDKVKISVVSKNAVPEKTQKFSDLSLTLASPRIDALVADALNISRDRAKRLVSLGLVSVNHAECLNPGSEFHEGDIVAVKGEGKFAVDAFLGLTAKNRHRVVVRKYL